ncbi:MAG: epimerase [Pseudomonas sp. PGPPP1]|uniref:NAD-dependent epimerase/dehydratase family protein n=1 Tax=Pseudomonas sp. PGPPP1 TaxID=2015553 RepID=UPI000BCBC736|nr:NAD(P)-dependent oxidoreductase [Pseudomonas sp. PGPPP1]OYU06325.1 MAG: epimerase [Pseudomonas sp. PGPPP1]
MKNILLTGASGFLGSALAHHWVRAGYKVSVLLRPESAAARIVDLMNNIQLYRCSGDDEVLSAIGKVAPDYIVHTACSYGRAGENLIHIFDANVRFGLLLLEGASRLDKQVTFLNTGTILDSSVSSYAMTKNSFSNLGSLQARWGDRGVQFINVALQHMYGPGDDKSKFTTYVIGSCIDNVERLRLTSGIQERDFIYVEDVVSAYDVILSNVSSFACAEEIEVGYGDAVSVKSFVELVHSMTASKTLLEFGAVPCRANEAMLLVADISRLRSLGWTPTISLKVGVQKIIDKDYVI